MALLAPIQATIMEIFQMEIFQDLISAMSLFEHSCLYPCNNTLSLKIIEVSFYYKQINSKKRRDLKEERNAFYPGVNEKLLVYITPELSQEG